MKKSKKRYRLKKWAQTVWATVWTLSFVFLIGLDTVCIYAWEIWEGRVVKKIVKRTDKSLWQVFREFDFDDKCLLMTLGFGSITVICLFILLLIIGFSVHWVFGIFTVLITLTLVPFLISGLWGDITSLLYGPYYTIDYEEIND